MIRQILHGNVQELYQDIVRDVPKGWIKAEVDKATESFFGAARIPNRSLVRLETPEGSQLMYTVCRRKENAKSISYFVHKQVFPCDGAELLDNFVQILMKPFCTEEEFDRMAYGERNIQPTSRLKGVSIGPIRPEVLRAVLYGIVGRWWAASAPVCISVPQGVDYDSYCGTVINTIYQYLPVGIRAQAGFMTYAFPDASLIDVALYFLPEGEWSGQIQLSAETPASRELLKTKLPPVLKGMIDKLFSIPAEAERREYLHRIYDGIEAGTDIGRIGNKSYEKYLQVLELDADMSLRQNFDRLNGAFADFDRCSKNVQTMLLRVLNDRVDTSILDLHLLTLPKIMQELPSYVKGLEAYAPMLRHSRDLSEHVRQKLMAQFGAIVDGQKDLKGLNYLGELLNQMEGYPGYFLNKATLALMRQKLETARRAPLDHEINRLILNAVTDINELADETDLDTLMDQADKIEEDLLHKIHQLDPGYDLNTVSMETRKARTHLITQWHTYNARDIREHLPRELTQKNYQRELKQLNDLIRQYPAYNAYYQPVLEELNSRYRTQGLERELDLKRSVYEESDYFRALEELHRCIKQYGIPEEEWRGRDYNYVNNLRPGTLQEYQRAYESHFGKPLSVDSLFELQDINVRVGVWKDLQRFYNKARSIPVRNADIKSVLDECIRIREICGVLSVPQGDRVILCGKTSHAYDSLALQNTLWWFQGVEVNGTLISNSDMVALIDQMEEMVLAPEQMLLILKKLLSANKDVNLISSAVTMLVKQDFDQHPQHFHEAEKLLNEYGYPDMYRDQKRGNIYYNNSFLDRVARRIERMKRNFSLKHFLREGLYWVFAALLFVAMYWMADKLLMPDVRPESPAGSSSVTETVPPETESEDPDDVAHLGSD